MKLQDHVYSGTVADHLNKDDIDLLARLDSHHEWWESRYEFGVDPYSKSSTGAILPECEAADRKGKVIKGVNLASQDYLGLASHPKIREAAKRAIDIFGVHSAGSPALMGNTAPSISLENELASFVKMKDCTVFPTGWAAGYGLIKCLVRPTDHIVIDQLSHASLMEGARNATNNIHIFPHLSLTGLERRLSRIRGADRNAGILVVTESLFSMDSDTPNIQAHQELSSKYQATLMVDAAHDIGCMGTTGRGHLEAQNMLGKIDILMGSFSKTFASNGGYVASNIPSLKLALRYGSGPQTFSNAISPVQSSIVLEALNIITSSEGSTLRDSMMTNARELRGLLREQSFKLIGAPSAIIPVILGDMKLSRLITKHTLDLGGIVNLVEYPAVSKNNSRFRLQVMATHAKEQLERFTQIVTKSRGLANSEMH